MSYEEIRQPIEAQFASAAWTATGILAYPANYFGPVGSRNEFIRTNILPASSEITTFNGAKTTNGMLIVNIFTEAGKGQKRVFEIADALDELLHAKKLSNNLLTKSSSLNFVGLDPDNHSLYRADYSLQFTKFK